ncbi:unnamed protein product [Anisakis simplex]|uniref:Adipocyte plasma membrane-associated protein (inferred by orthology to a human protein) n=1 Tax=Anisakis simplex TaxID=6269 RepID=A0A0M3KBV5_ANISI|nr:unnamed protein product [Anisakis simplex]
MLDSTSLSNRNRSINRQKPPLSAESNAISNAKHPRCIIYRQFSEALQWFNIHEFPNTLIFSSLTAIVLLLLVVLADKCNQSVDFALPAPPTLTGALSPNRLLSNGDRLLEGVLYGPESLALHISSDFVYTGLKTGHIVGLKMEKNRYGMEIVHKFEPINDVQGCDGSYLMQPLCGRPLGLRFRKHNTNVLLVADAYHGLYELDIRDGKRTMILSNGTQLWNASNALPLRHFNDFDETEDGKIILSEPSMKFSDRDCLYAMNEHGADGRVLVFDERKRRLSVLIDRLQYPNGIQLTTDQRCVLIAEMGNLRILKHCFDSNPSSNYSTLADNLPGYPDNIRLAMTGSLWIPLGQVRLDDDRWITTRPWLRNLVAVLFPQWLFATLLDWLNPMYGMVLLMHPENGSIIESFHDAHGETITSISHVLEIGNDTILLGGDDNNFLVQLNTSKHRN